MKVISVHFVLPGEQATETGEGGTDLKIDRKSEKGTDKRVQIRKSVERKKKVSGSLRSKTQLISERGQIDGENETDIKTEAFIAVC